MRSTNAVNLMAISGLWMDQQLRCCDTAVGLASRNDQNVRTHKVVFRCVLSANATYLY
jgi:hypothetical protein